MPRSVLSARDQIDALRAERAEFLGFAHSLTTEEWTADSAAAGWRVHDVVAHLGATSRAIFSPSAQRTLASAPEIERANDVFVERRRGWPRQRVLDEYTSWSLRAVRLGSALWRTPMARHQVRVGELGRFPAALALTGALTFDHHLHLRLDLAPALGHSLPPADPARTAAVVEWMLAVLANQLGQDRPAGLDRPLTLTLDGPGGGEWRVAPDGSVTAGPAADGHARVVTTPGSFMSWATRRSDWRTHPLEITGDEALAAGFLDRVDVV